MRDWLRGPRAGLAVFLAVTVLVAGGLGWATSAALDLEREQREARAETDLGQKLRRALWRLDGQISPILARESARPYNHYSAIYRPPQALVYHNGRPATDVVVLELSPLVDAELPPWMLLHFQADDEGGWGSPQLPFKGLESRMNKKQQEAGMRNRTGDRARLLAELNRQFPAHALVALTLKNGGQLTFHDSTLNVWAGNSAQASMAQNPVGQPGQGAQSKGVDNDVQQRFSLQAREQNNYTNQRLTDNREAIFNNLQRQGMNWLVPSPKQPVSNVEVAVNLGPMQPVWAGYGDQERLLLVRQVQIEDGKGARFCQGIVLDAERLQAELLEEVRDLFPEATLSAVREEVAPNPERTMATLPFQLEPGDPAGSPLPTWTPLRIGLALAWIAAGVALLAVGLGGWSLLDLSERRFRFVSAVTHELRTPLTTLRLYLDMLTGGMVKDEQKRAEYLRTLHAEADRLSRLVANVLDFSRLEKQRPRLIRSKVAVSGLLEGVRQTWQGRCHDAGKDLVIENALPPGAELTTDTELAGQVLANLIDNA
jgi:His Kinase A (phospho-acceptor) domain